MKIQFLMVLITVSLIPALAGDLRITAPSAGSYVSGSMDVKLAYDEPDAVQTTRLRLDGEEVARADGWRDTLTVDFGDSFAARLLQASFILRDGTEIESPVVRTKEIAISVTATTELMLIGAVVKDRRNRLLTDLERDRFRVYENGRELPIQAFLTEELDLDVVLMLDTSSSLRGKGFPELQQAARVFIQQLRNNDRGLLFEFKDEPAQLSEFTTDKPTLITMVDRLEPLGATALFDALHEGVEIFQKSRRSRKAMVLFTDGKDSVYETPRKKADMLRSGITAAQNAEVTVYTIGLGENIHKDALRRIAEDTGGRFHHADNVERLPAIFGEIVEDLKHQYVLGVAPTASRRGFNELEIQVRKRGAEVFARKGYTRD